MVTRIYFNANWNPEVYYAALKSAVVLYEQIWLWSPTMDDVAQFTGSSPEEVFTAADTTTGRPLIVPAGRKLWFEQMERRQHPRAVEALLGSADRYRSSLDSDYDAGYAELKSAWRDQRRREQDSDSLKKVAGELSERVRNEVQRVADKHKESEEWGIANAYIQDYHAIQKLGVSYPLMPTSLGPGYQVLATPGEERPPAIRARIIERAGNDMVLPELPDGMTLNM